MTQSLGKPRPTPEARRFSAALASRLRLLYSQERST
jgi:hypothetical protein